jgi:hypothetical protein
MKILDVLSTSIMRNEMKKSNIDFFAENKYCIVKSAISEELRDFVTQYALFDEMQDFASEEMQGRMQVPNAHSKYADPAMESMLLHLQPIMEKNTGLKLIPTYSYYRVYRNGDDLKKHTDRPSCEVSATLCFNYDYDDKDYEWPIFMNGNSLTLKPGDMAIYRGCDLDHWREPFEYFKSSWHVQGFFHYVDANGPYAEYKYDKRNSIGDLLNLKPTLPSYIQFMQK